MLQDAHSLGPCHVWRQPDAQLPQQHRPQEGLQTPAGTWGMFCSKTSLCHHTTLSPNPGPRSSQEKWEFWGTGTNWPHVHHKGWAHSLWFKQWKAAVHELQYLDRACTGQTHMKFLHWVHCQHSVLPTESTKKGFLWHEDHPSSYTRAPLGAIWEPHFGPPALLAYLLLSPISTFHTKDVEVQARCLFSSFPFYTWPDS